MPADIDIWQCSDCGNNYAWGKPCPKHGSYNSQNDRRLWKCSADGSVMDWDVWNCSKCNGKYESPTGN